MHHCKWTINFFAVFLGCLLSLNAYAAGGGSEKPWVRLEHQTFNVSDLESVKRGAEIFMTQCAACHRMHQLKFDSISRKAREAVMGQDEIEWFDKAASTMAPDLSLITRSKSPEWVYTYLKSYYKKPDGTYGNLLISNSMPFVGVLQGKSYDYVLSKDFKRQYKGNTVGTALVPIDSDTEMDPYEYNLYLKDLVTYLAYAGEPTQVQRLAMAPYVLIYVAILVVICYIMYREYWRKIK